MLLEQYLDRVAYGNGMANRRNIPSRCEFGII